MSGSDVLSEEWRPGRRPRPTPRLWTGARSQRARAALRMPQVVVKVTGKSQGRAKVRARLWYISHEGELALEREDGTTAVGRSEIDRLVDEWSAHFSTRSNGRDTVQLSFSVPESEIRGSEEGRAQVLDAVRSTAAREWAGNHPYVFAAHRDSGNFHVHVVVRMRGRDGRQLATKKADLERWRMRFAEASRERGLWVDASPRVARGKTARNVATAVHRKQARGERLQSDSMPSTAEARRWEERLRQRNVQERRAYAEQSLEAAREALALGEPSSRERALRLALELGRFAVELPFDFPRSEGLRQPVRLARRVEGAERVYAAVAGLRGEGSVAVRSDPRGWVEVERAAELSARWRPSAACLEFVAQERPYVGRAEQARTVLGLAATALRVDGQHPGHALRAEVLDGRVRVHAVVEDPDQAISHRLNEVSRRFARSALAQGYGAEQFEERPGLREVRPLLRELAARVEEAIRILDRSTAEGLRRDARSVVAAAAEERSRGEEERDVER